MNAPDALASAAAGMRAQAARLDLIAADLANAGTPGYRSLVPVGARFADRLGAAAGTSSAQGALRSTGVPTDLALSGPGYFAVATPDGVRYTRDGRLTADPSGTLVDARGNRVLGTLGPVRFPHRATVESDGRIVCDGQTIDRLRVVEVAGAVDQANGYCVALPGATLTRAAAQVRAGFLEDSGVNPIAEMTALVSSQRAFEANQKAAQRADETLRRAVTDVPAVHP
ncbi:MAG TPA: flagellar hook basal-body protein [Candidatus Eremiobacteraceae bacterium]